MMIPIISSKCHCLSLHASMKSIVLGRQFATTSTATRRICTATGRQIQLPSINNQRLNYHHNYHIRSLSSSSSTSFEKDKYLLPKRIILLRHGESLGNIDETAYASIPDWKIPMTRRYVHNCLFACYWDCLHHPILFVLFILTMLF